MAKNSKTFEESVSRLEEIVRTLESGAVSLDESLKIYKEGIELVRRVRDRMKLPAAILLDTKGPEIRLRDFEGGKVTLKAGDTFTLTTTDCMGEVVEKDFEENE